jgi:hypothetical protein
MQTKKVSGLNSELCDHGSAAKSVKSLVGENNKQNKLRGSSPPANYIDRVTAACRRS